MPTYSSPIDPLFPPWHSFIDLLLFLWEACRLDKSTVTETKASWMLDADASCTYTEDAGRLFPETNTTSEFYMKSNGDDIRDNPLIGKYFASVGLTLEEVAYTRHLGENEFIYDHLTLPLWEVLQDPILCPAAATDGWFTAFPTGSPSIGPPIVPPAPDELEAWIADIRIELAVLYADDPDRQEHMLLFLFCTLGNDTTVPTDADFRQAFLQGDVSDPKCNFFLLAPENGGSGPAAPQDEPTGEPHASAPTSSPMNSNSGASSTTMLDDKRRIFIVLQIFMLAVAVVLL